MVAGNCCTTQYNTYLALVIPTASCFDSVLIRAVVAYLKVVRRRKSSSADGTRRGEQERGTPPLVRVFMRLGPDFSHDFLLEKIFLGV